MAEEKGTNTDWLTGHLAFLRGLKSPSDTQKLLILLAGKKEKTQKEERTFAMLVKSEKALERAKKARAEVVSMLSDEKRKAAKEERASRTHKLIQLGLLFSYAGIEDAPREFLAGLAVFGSKMDESMKREVMALGADLLATKEPKKPPAAAAAPAPRPAPAAAPAAASAPRSAPAPAPAAVKTYLTPGVSDKEAVKALGAHFDYDAKKWFVPPGADLTRFKKWIV